MRRDSKRASIELRRQETQLGILVLQLRTSADNVSDYRRITVGIHECNFFVNLPVESRDWINHKPEVQIASARDREGTSSILKSVIAINLNTMIRIV